MTPELFLIAGPNGAGKSSLGKDLLPDRARTLDVFDGDKIYYPALEAAFLRVKVAKFAQREAMQTTIEAFEQRVEAALSARQSFAYEGHFNGPGPWETVQRFRREGYEAHLLFLGLSDVTLSVARVEKRREQGGHWVSPEQVARNFEGNLDYLDAHFRLLTSVQVLDTSTPQPRALLSLGLNGPGYRAPELPDWARVGLPKLAEAAGQALRHSETNSRSLENFHATQSRNQMRLGGQ